MLSVLLSTLAPVGGLAREQSSITRTQRTHARKQEQIKPVREQLHLTETTTFESIHRHAHAHKHARTRAP